MASRVKIVKDTVPQVFTAITSLVGKQVLVGIPEAKNHRQDDPVNNASIGYFMEFGVPSQNVPARAFLIPGVQKAQGPALEQLKAAATAALDGNKSKVDQSLNAAGILAMNSARKEIGSNIPPPLSPSTVAERARQRGSKSMRKSEMEYFDLLDKGSSPGAAQSAAGIVALVNSGQLRNSITYVVRTKK